MRLDPDRLSFDRYERIRRLAEAIERLDREGAGRVLDVGGYPGLLADALPEREVWTLDRAEGRRQRYVRASGAELPFAEEHFKIVVASDTLEHVPESERGAFIDECARVCQRFLLLSGPFDTPGVAWAERKVNDWHTRLNGAPNSWLQQHIDARLPLLREPYERLRERGADTHVYPHGDLTAWLLLLFAELSAAALPGAQAAVEAISRAHNRHWADREPGEATYRHILVADLRPGDGGDGFQSLPWQEIDVAHPTDGGVQDRLAALCEGLGIVVDSLSALGKTAGAGRAPETSAYIATLEAALKENQDPPVPTRSWLSRLWRKQ